MLSKKTIAESLLRIKINYSINITDANLQIMIDTIFDICDDVTDEQFITATRQIIKNGSELYGKLPPVAMFRELIFGKPLTAEEIANKEVADIMQAISSYWGSLESKYPNTLKTVKDLGGLGALKWRLDSDNDNKEKAQWVRKEIFELWLSNYHLESGQNCLSSDNAKILNDLASNLGNKLTGF
tara:strand:- start:684 stop:1235 length:552 start_codon:yes stop_codon:yes gene_type:complete